MDNDYPIDVDEIVRVLGTAEVIVFRFVIVPDRLLVDPRTGDDEGPMVRLVKPARSAEERFRSLRQLRPRLRAPERITVIHWPKFIDRLESSGVWAAIDRRMEQAGSSQTTTADVRGELRRLERQQIQKAIRGDGFQTTWERKVAGE